MTLFQAVQQAVEGGYRISFERELTQLVITVYKHYSSNYRDGVIKSKQQYLPMEDHFTEDRLVGCIKLLTDEI